MNTWHFIARFKISDKAKSLQTFVAESESPLLSSLEVSYPQVVIVDEGYEVRIPGADLGIHARPWALGLNLDWLDRSRLLKPTSTVLVKRQTEDGLLIAKTQESWLEQAFF